MMLKIILFLPPKILSERQRRQRQLSAVKNMFYERSLVPLPCFKRLGDVIGKNFCERKGFRSKFGAAYADSATKVWLAT